VEKVPGSDEAKLDNGYTICAARVWQHHTEPGRPITAARSQKAV
jgi:hypothetical protein